MAKLPEFLYVPYLGDKYPTDKLIISTKHTITWNVLEFDNTIDRDVWLVDNEQKLKDSGAVYVSMHKKYPYLLICNNALVEIDLTFEKIASVSHRASDWYAEHFLRDKAKSKSTDNYKSFYICENRIEYPGQEAIIKLSYPRVFIRYNVGEAYFSTYDQFYNAIATVDWLDAEKPSDKQELEQIYRDCYNYMIMEEIKLEQDMEDMEDE